jgi:hypothetical protein
MEVVHAYFRRDAFVVQRYEVCKKLQLTGRADVQDMQAGAVLFGQLHRFERRLKTRLHIADDGVVGRRKFTFFFFKLSRDFFNDGLFLAVRGDQQFAAAKI